MAGDPLLREYLLHNQLSPWAVKRYDKRTDTLLRATREHVLQVVVWEATRRCDLRCIHCGTPSEETESSEELPAHKVMDIFGRIDAAFGLKSLTAVSITGGEPTVRQDLAKIVAGIHSFGVDQIVMHTNGHNMANNPTLVSDLVSTGITGIGVNLDGMRDNHNWIRQHDSSFDLSVRALELAKGQGADTMVSTIVMNRVVDDLRPLSDLIAELQPGRWRLIPLEPIGRAKAGDALSPEMLARTLEFMLEIISERPDLNVEFGCGQWFGKKLEGLVRPYIWHCIAGLNVMGILHDGMIGACNNIDRHYCQGNALQDDIFEVWESRFRAFRQRDWCRTGECSDCDDWGLCRGGEMHLRNATGERIAPCFFCWLEKNYQRVR